jgi:hypothetical protein
MPGVEIQALNAGMFADIGHAIGRTGAQTCFSAEVSLLTETSAEKTVFAPCNRLVAVLC